MKDWRTSLGGIIAGLATIAKAVGIDVPAEVVDGILAIALFAMGIAAKDKKNTD